MDRIFEEDRVRHYFHHDAILIGYMNPGSFLRLSSVGPKIPGSYIDPMTQRYLEKTRKYNILRIYWDPVKGRDVEHDGRNRAYFLKTHGVKRAKVMVLFTHHFSPVPINKLTDRQYREFLRKTGIHPVGKLRRWKEIIAPIKV